MSEGPKKEGITLFTVHVRRGAPDVQDPMWNSHSKLNCIAACIQVRKDRSTVHICVQRPSREEDWREGKEEGLHY